MRFSEWTLEEFINYLHLAKCGMDYTCRTMVSGEIHIYNGERKDGQPSLTIDELVGEDK